MTIWLNHMGLEDVGEFSFRNIYCMIQESDSEFKIKKDESFKSKPYLAPFKVFFILLILHIWLSITCILFSLLVPSFINSVIIGLTSYIISYIFFRQFKHYRGLNIEISFDKLFQKINIQKSLPKNENLGLIRFADVEAIILYTNYFIPEQSNLSFLLKNGKKFEFFEGKRDDCLRFSNLFSAMLEKPVYFKDKLNWVLILCNLGFIFLLLTSIILNDIIGQILFFVCLIFSNIFNLTSILETNLNNS